MDPISSLQSLFGLPAVSDGQSDELIWKVYSVMMNKMKSITENIIAQTNTFSVDFIDVVNLKKVEFDYWTETISFYSESIVRDVIFHSGEDFDQCCTYLKPLVEKDEHCSCNCIIL
eukprot:360241_1